jgi:hypothetical protein
MAVYTNNIVFYTGTDFEQIFVLENDDGPFILSGYIAIAKMKKHGGSTTATSFLATIADANSGRVKISMGAQDTTSISPGRYYYDLVLYKDGENTRVIEGDVIVKLSVTR